MPQTIQPGPHGDTPKTIEDKVRALPANQGKNENVMWALIDAEIVAAQAAGKLKNVETYTPQQKHGK